LSYVLQGCDATTSVSWLPHWRKKSGFGYWRRKCPRLCSISSTVRYP